MVNSTALPPLKNAQISIVDVGSDQKVGIPQKTNFMKQYTRRNNQALKHKITSRPKDDKKSASFIELKTSSKVTGHIYTQNNNTLRLPDSIQKKQIAHNKFGRVL